MIARPTYIEQLKPFINKHQIKILTGIRRSGKSTVLLLLKDELLASGVRKEQIISINFESFAYSHLLTATNLYQYIMNEVKTSGKIIFLTGKTREIYFCSTCAKADSR